MTTVRATCCLCGKVRLPSDDVVLVLDRTGRNDNYYTFQCPDCGQVNNKPASGHAIRLLLAAEVAVRERHATPPPHPEAPPVLPPLEPDDLLDAHLWLAATDDIVGAAQ